MQKSLQVKANTTVSQALSVLSGEVGLTQPLGTYYVFSCSHLTCSVVATSPLCSGTDEPISVASFILVSVKFPWLFEVSASDFELSHY